MRESKCEYVLRLFGFCCDTPQNNRNENILSDWMFGKAHLGVQIIDFMSRIIDFWNSLVKSVDIE